MQTDIRLRCHRSCTGASPTPVCARLLLVFAGTAAAPWIPFSCDIVTDEARVRCRQFAWRVLPAATSTSENSVSVLAGHEGLLRKQIPC